MRHRNRLFPILWALALCVAGPAFADGIEITGEASMGLGGGTDQTGTSSLRMIGDLDLRMRLSTTTDNGLTFALELDLDDLDLDEAPGGHGIPRRR